VQLTSKVGLEDLLKKTELERDRALARLEKLSAEDLQRLTEENTKIKEELSKLENKNQFLIKETQKGIEITFLDKILFDAGKADLKRESAKIMQNVAQILNKYPKRNIIIEGHTDNQPIKSEKYHSNWDLSAARALAVLNALVATGKINRERLSIQAFADTRPVADNKTVEGRKQNRRVEIILLPADLKIEKKETVK